MFLRNGWYTALWSHELKDKPVAKTLLNEKIVLFRNAGGDVGALEDCCCHRAAPLSLGEISGDYLACGYHGLKFDVNGKCVEVPARTQVPSGAKVRSYPVAEKWNVVWIWMGDPAKAEPGKIPDMPWLSEPKWTATPGRLYVKSNYQFIVDNLLDFTHVAHVHKRTIAGDPREATEPIKSERLNDGIRVSRWLLDVLPPPLFANAGNFKSNVDRWQLARWHPPGVVYLDVGCAKAGTGAPQGDRGQGISIWSTHLHYTRNRAHQPLHVLLLTRLQPRRRRDVEASLRRVACDFSGGCGLPRGGADQPGRRFAGRPYSSSRRCRPATSPAHARQHDIGGAGVIRRSSADCGLPSSK